MIKFLPVAGFVFFTSAILAGCSKTSISAAGLSGPGTGILFASDRDNNWEVYLMQPDGAGLLRLTDHLNVDSAPSWFPDGTKIAFRSRRDGSSDIFQMSLDGSQLQNLVKDDMDSLFDEFSPKMNPSGKIFALYSDRFPVSGDCRAGVHHLAFMPSSGRADRIENFTSLTGEQTSMSWSPDGRYLAFSSVCNESHSRIYIYDMDDQAVSQITPKDDYAGFPDWSPNGEKIAYASDQTGNVDIFIMTLETGETFNLTNHPANDTEPSWAPDGTAIAFTTDRDGNDEVYTVDLDGRNPLNLTNHPASDNRPDWSPIQ
jgi:Tol biopolymer transport system component